MSIGHPLELSGEPHVPAAARSVDPGAWAEARLPTLLDPRSLVGELHRIHLPRPGVTVLGVLSTDGRVVGGASFVVPERITDGWHLRNVLLAHLRHLVPHGLRRLSPLHSAVVLQCREAPAEWTELDGAWMWALRDASVLHGLRCGGYITLTDEGWHVLGEHRRGRSPQADPWARRALGTVSELPSREQPGAEQSDREQEAGRVARDRGRPSRELPGRAEPEREHAANAPLVLAVEAARPRPALLPAPAVAL